MGEVGDVSDVAPTFGPMNFLSPLQGLRMKLSFSLYQLKEFF